MNLKNIEAGCKRVKKVFFLKKVKATGLIKKIHNYVFFESVVVNDIINVHIT